MEKSLTINTIEVCMCVCVHDYMYVCTYICTCTYYICTCVCVCSVYMTTCMYVRIYVHTY